MHHSPTERLARANPLALFGSPAKMQKKGYPYSRLPNLEDLGPMERLARVIDSALLFFDPWPPQSAAIS